MAPLVASTYRSTDRGCEPGKEGQKQGHVQLLAPFQIWTQLCAQAAGVTPRLGHMPQFEHQCKIRPKRDQELRSAWQIAGRLRRAKQQRQPAQQLRAPAGSTSDAAPRAGPFALIRSSTHQLQQLSQPQADAPPMRAAASTASSASLAALMVGAQKADPGDKKGCESKIGRNRGAVGRRGKTRRAVRCACSCGERAWVTSVALAVSPAPCRSQLSFYTG